MRRESISNKDGYKVSKYTKKDQYIVRVEKVVDATVEELRDFIHDGTLLFPSFTFSSLFCYMLH
jgi:hypothetical protein